MGIGLILLIVLAVVVLYVIGAYNGLVRLKNRSEEAWSDIDVQLKRRYDLIPNLVEIAKGYLKHEREVLENVTKARQQAMCDILLAVEEGQQQVLRHEHLLAKAAHDPGGSVQRAVQLFGRDVRVQGSHVPSRAWSPRRAVPSGTGVAAYARGAS